MLVLGQSRSSLPPTEGGPMSFAGSAHHSLSELIEEQPVLPTHPPRPQAAFCHINAFNGISGRFNRYCVDQNQCKQRMGREKCGQGW